VAIAVIYVLTILPAMHAVMVLPGQPIRDVVRVCRPEAVSDDRTITATFPSTGGARLYDERAHVIESVDELNGLVDEAFKNDRPFFVYQRVAESSPYEWPQIREELEKSGRFRLVQEFAALASFDCIRLYRYYPREKIIHLDLKPGKQPTRP
jgi:hypothetical protein